jgi:hypothetical protein
MPGIATPNLSDRQLQELLGLLKGADSAELKLTVPDDNLRAAIDGLGLDPLEAQIRQVFFFDTPDLRLNKAGVVARARRVQGKGDDSVVKLRPVTPAQLPEELRHAEAFGVEVDAMPGGFVCSGTFKRTMAGGPVREAVTGGRPLRKLFSKEQRAFYAAHAPEGLELDDLSILGPVFVLKLKTLSKGFDRRLVSEVWLFPDGFHILELSTKCPPSEALQTAAEARAFLSECGVDLAGDQAAKTRRALKFFSARLRQAEAATT